MTEPSSQYSQAHFEGALHTSFAIAPDAAGAGLPALRLVEVKSRPAPQGYEQFSALFIGPASPIMPQGMYRLVHESLGEFDLFMVPVGRATDGIQYEACISRDSRGPSQASG